MDKQFKNYKELRELLRVAVNLGDVKKSIHIAQRLGISKNKICLMSSVDPSNYLNYEIGNRKLPEKNKEKILKTISEILL